MKKLAFVVAVAAAGMASADTVALDFTGTGKGQNVSLSVSGGSYYNQWAGQLKFTLSATASTPAGFPTGSLILFCTELTQYAADGTFDISALDTAPTSGPMGSSAADAIRELYAIADPAQFGSSNKDAAAFQIAVWELAYDYDGTNGSKSFGAGAVRVSAPADVLTQANTWLSSVDGFGPRTSLKALTHSSKQDQIIVVPLPGTVALGLAGLAGVGVVRRFRPR